MMFSMKRAYLFPLTALLALLAVAAFGPAPAVAQEGIVVELPCVTGVTAFPIGQAMPADLDGRVLVLERLEIAPGGGFTAHTHPGTLVVSIEAGELELTQLDHADMEITRGATDSTPATTETMAQGVPLTLFTGDGFVEPEGMVHVATNTGDEPTIVLLTGVVDPSLPLVQCVEGTPTA
jgi:quercetin dioxygenase-like cupin family protein